MLKSIGQFCARLRARFRRLSQTVAKLTEERQRQAIVKSNEAERLDRIRNPAKYRGK